MSSTRTTQIWRGASIGRAVCGTVCGAADAQIARECPRGVACLALPTSSPKASREYTEGLTDRHSLAALSEPRRFAVYVQTAPWPAPSWLGCLHFREPAARSGTSRKGSINNNNNDSAREVDGQRAVADSRVAPAHPLHGGRRQRPLRVQRRVAHHEPVGLAPTDISRAHGQHGPAPLDPAP